MISISDKQTMQTNTNLNDLFKKIEERIEEATTSIEAKMNVLQGNSHIDM